MPALKALALLVYVLTGLVVLTALFAAIMCVLDGVADCRAWRQRYVSCEEHGCKDRLHIERPFACAVVTQ